jgi:hypothetical protein
VGKSILRSCRPIRFLSRSLFNQYSHSPRNSLVASLVHAAFRHVVRSIPARTLPYLLRLRAAIDELRRRVSAGTAFFINLIVFIKAQ